MSRYLDEIDAILSRRDLPRRACARCGGRAASDAWCEGCLHDVNSRVAEKRDILLPQTSAADTLSAFA